MDFKISDIYIGVNDGKKEALYKSDFEKYFIDYNNMYDEVLKPEKYLILGQKGSGKTILAQYIKKQSKINALWFCDIKSFKDFRFHELVHLKTNDIAPNEYSAIWRWIILVELSKQILQDNGIQDKENLAKLETFFKENYYSIDIDSKKVVELTKTRKINGSILKSILALGGELSSESTHSESSYLSYLEDLERVLLKLLSTSKSRHTIFFDELDDRFQNDIFYKNSIISLIKSADSINCTLVEKNLDAKIILLIRSDIFSILNDTDLNKIKLSNSIEITWGEKVSAASPLISLLIQKAKRSNRYLDQFEDIEVFNQLFPQHINGVKPERFMLERTLFRPRDLVTFLNLIITRYPSSRYFGWKGFLEMKNKYSEYFIDEIRNEMSGHLESEEIDQGLRLLKNYNRYFFMYTELKDYYASQRVHYPKIELDKLLVLFFKFNVIGNKWHNAYKNKEYYTWAHRDHKAELDFGKQLVIHLGLREELSM
ncbi:P-loop ATPase, Sll1717 family [Chryseolinea lacunae]|uniref:KAP NTPase domain-containing protein n=1 Tax=Chryseolinea lacunae TaxID=2801331 RepID=A0ABS1KK89_9BACT|nr:hypothetical protein [Chryseolinea lacunae]MBL0739874.1 hypothetical protein [Chryseolinea lacunae]